MLELVQNFVEASSEARDREALSNLFDSAVSSLGFENFSAWSLIDRPEMPDETILVLRYPESWVDYYRDMDFWRVDPIYRLGMESAVPLLWSDVMSGSQIRKAEQRFMDEAATAGLKYGLTVPVRGARMPPGNVSIYSDRCDFDPNSKHTLHLLSIYLYEAGCRIALQEQNCELPKVAILLTARERECVKWASIGKTDWEIGEILGISQSTAHFHIEKAKKKFGVPTRTQAVVQAVITNQIIP